MKEKERFEETIKTMSLEDLQELSNNLSMQFTRAKNCSTPNEEQIKELERKFLAVQNRITALKIRC